MNAGNLSTPRYHEIMKSGGKVWAATFGKMFTFELNRWLEYLEDATRRISGKEEHVFVGSIGVHNLSYPSRMGA